jgi:RHS repeat-associated protein
MSYHPITTPASPSLASPLFDASCDSVESLTTSFVASVVPTLETTNVTEVALGYHRNQQYSITAMTTSSGAVAERYAYTAYGQPTILNASGTVLTSSAVGNRYTYTGREWDETLGLHHFRARWMSPLAGRFLGRDPIGYVGSPVNLYLALDTNPTKKVDPSGKATLKELEDECVRLKDKVFAHSIPQNCKNNGWQIELQCTKCFPELGIISCKDTNSNKVIIRICFREHKSFAQLAQTFRHELQHASDFCECGCSKFRRIPDPDRPDLKNEDFCFNQLCTEVRAFAQGGTCDGKPDDERKACIRQILVDSYVKELGCDEGILDVVMSKCYVKEGDFPPVFPNSPGK